MVATTGVATAQKLFAMAEKVGNSKVARLVGSGIGALARKPKMLKTIFKQRRRSSHKTSMRFKNTSNGVLSDSDLSDFRDLLQAEKLYRFAYGSDHPRPVGTDKESVSTYANQLSQALETFLQSEDYRQIEATLYAASAANIGTNVTSGPNVAISTELQRIEDRLKEAELGDLLSGLYDDPSDEFLIDTQPSLVEQQTKQVKSIAMSAVSLLNVLGRYPRLTEGSPNVMNLSPSVFRICYNNGNFSDVANNSTGVITTGLNSSHLFDTAFFGHLENGVTSPNGTTVRKIWGPLALQKGLNPVAQIDATFQYEYGPPEGPNLSSGTKTASTELGQSSFHVSIIGSSRYITTGSTDSVYTRRTVSQGFTTISGTLVYRHAAPGSYRAYDSNVISRHSAFVAMGISRNSDMIDIVTPWKKQYAVLGDEVLMSDDRWAFEFSESCSHSLDVVPFLVVVYFGATSSYHGKTSGDVTGADYLPANIVRDYEMHIDWSNLEVTSTTVLSFAGLISGDLSYPSLKYGVWRSGSGMSVYQIIADTDLSKYPEAYPYGTVFQTLYMLQNAYGPSVPSIAQALASLTSLEGSPELVDVYSLCQAINGLNPSVGGSRAKLFNVLIATAPTVAYTTGRSQILAELKP